MVRSQMVSLKFFIDVKSFRSHYGSGVDSASNRNEYQEHFLGGKGGRCVRLTNLPLSCAVVMESGNLNFLEHSGPLQACNGTALPVLSRSQGHSVTGKIISMKNSKDTICKLPVYGSVSPPTVPLLLDPYPMLTYYETYL